MEELNITELLQYYLKKLPIIILTAILAILVGYFYIKNIQTPLYHGDTTIILVQQNNSNVNSTVTQNELTINEKLVSTYSEVIKSKRVLNQVINNLELDLTYGELYNNVTVSAVTNTSIIKISISDANKEQAATIANELAKVFKDEIVKIYNLENISVIDEAVVQNKPYNINMNKQLIIYALISIIITCGIIFIIYYFDNTVKNKKVIETKFNLPVLGEVPIANRLEAEDKKRQKKLQKQNNEKEGE